MFNAVLKCIFVYRSIEVKKTKQTNTPTKTKNKTISFASSQAYSQGSLF